MNAAFVSVLAVIVIFWMIFGHLIFLRTILAFSLMSYEIFGKPLAAFLPFTAFDPLHLVLAKGMYLEFVFLHPLTFFIGFIYALYTFYNYMFKERRNHGDLFLSSWLLFGFLFLTIMYYSPSRYYLLFIIPLIVLAARFITGTAAPAVADYITEKKKFPHGLLLALFLIFGALYTGIVVLVQAVPVSARNMLIDRLYPYYLAHDYRTIALLAALAVLVLVACSAAAVLNRKRLLELLRNPKFSAVILALILALQLFQYGKWFLFHDHSLYEASREVGRDLPPDAVLAGSWSSGLVVENRIMPLVVQSLIPYNHNLIKKMTYDVPVPVNSLSDGKKSTEYRSNIPLYIAVCRNVIFEKAIADLYRDHFTRENLVKTFRFGFFKIEIFKMKKYRLKSEDEVRRFLKSFFRLAPCVLIALPLLITPPAPAGDSPVMGILRFRSGGRRQRDPCSRLPRHDRGRAEGPALRGAAARYHPARLCVRNGKHHIRGEPAALRGALLAAQVHAPPARDGSSPGTGR